MPLIYILLVLILTFSAETAAADSWDSSAEIYAGYQVSQVHDDSSSHYDYYYGHYDQSGFAKQNEERKSEDYQSDNDENFSDFGIFYQLNYDYD